jgi:1-deoxy-D-xylulose-5-phosphate synthase
MAKHQYKNELSILGIPDRIIEHGTLKELHKEGGYDAQAIADTVREMMKTMVKVTIPTVNL